jgi:iron complex transport system substrate-binding protein
MQVTTPGGSVTLSHEPHRIVCLSPTATEMLFAIGAGPQVVAVDSYSNHPSSAPRTKLSAYSPNVEAIASYNPDLVVAQDDTGGLARSLRSLGIPFVTFPPASDLGGTYSQISELGRITDQPSGAAAVIGRMRSEIAKIVASVPKPSSPLSVYVELDPTYYSATSATFLGQVFSMFGVSNIADAAGLHKNSGFPQLSAEYVVSSDPRLIVLADTVCCHQSPQTVAARPGWGTIQAVERGLVFNVNDSLASRWGPRIVGLVRTVAGEVIRAERSYESG